MSSAYSDLWLIQPFYDGHQHPNVDANKLMRAFNPNIQEGDVTYGFLRGLGIEAEMKGQAEYEGSGMGNTLQALLSGDRIQGEVEIEVKPSWIRLFNASRDARLLTKQTGKVHRRKVQKPIKQVVYYTCLRADEELLRMALLNYEEFGKSVRDNPCFGEMIEKYVGVTNDCPSTDPDCIKLYKQYIRHTWMTTRHHWYQNVKPVFFTLSKEIHEKFEAQMVALEEAVTGGAQNG